MLTALWMCAVARPGPPPETLDLAKAVNEIRRQYDLPPVQRNRPLAQAAQSHCDYMVANRTSGHLEDPQRPGFLGRTPDDRARAKGFVGPNSEAVALSTRPPLAILRSLFDAPYHRVMFLQPASPYFGGGTAGNAMCLKFGGRTGDGIVQSPPDGACGVPLRWDGVETPDPLRFDRVRTPVGYPIVVACFGASSLGVQCKGAELRGPEGRLEVIVLDPERDPFAKGAVVVIPRRPLSPEATYSVRVRLTSNGAARTLSWSFST